MIDEPIFSPKRERFILEPRNEGAAHFSGAPVYKIKTWGLITVLGVACVVLLVDAFSFKQATQSLLKVVVHGQGERFALSARQSRILEKDHPSEELFEAFLEAERDNGLEYLGLKLEESGELLVEAGVRPQTYKRLRPGRPYVQEDHILMAVPASKPRGSASKKNPRRVLIFKYEPLQAKELNRRANLQVLIMLVTTLLVLGMGWKLSTTLRQQERLQALYQQRQRLAELGQMSAVLAHELRNPLTSLKGHAQLLHESLEDHGDKLTKKAERLIYESTRLEHLVNSLLEFVRTGELRTSIKAVGDSMRQFVRDTSQVKLHLSMEAEGTTWLVDMVRMQVAVSNVVDNAIKQSVPGSSVQIYVRCEGDAVVVNVEDDGEGIPDELQGQLFEPFVTSRVNGVGLGLAVARDIIESHGGTIHAQNKTIEQGPGARFIIKLPQAH